MDRGLLDVGSPPVDLNVILGNEKRMAHGLVLLAITRGELLDNKVSVHVDLGLNFYLHVLLFLSCSLIEGSLDLAIELLNLLVVLVFVALRDDL